MGITEQEAIKELQTRDEIFVAYSQATKLPYVICDQESFNDQVWVFATEEEIKAFGTIAWRPRQGGFHQPASCAPVQPVPLVQPVPSASYPA